MPDKPTVLLLGTLDTKGFEYRIFGTAFWQMMSMC